MSAYSPLSSRSLLRLLSATALLMPVGKQRFYSSAPAAAFTYRLGVASVGKNTSPRPPKLGRDYWNYASTGSSAVPYLKSSKPDSGEDAFFATSIGSSTHAVAFGLADGVGGWQESGVDPSKFSHGLCRIMVETAFKHDNLEVLPKPQELLQVAYDGVSNDPKIDAGGCTASLAVADGAGHLDTANLGDSGYVIFSPGRVAARSEAQTHAFNTPYQMAKIPKAMRQQAAIFGTSHHSETPKDADIARHKLKHGDVVLFGTDGVWDNLSAQDTLAIVDKVMAEHNLWFKSHNFADAETMLNTTGVRAISQDPKDEDAPKYVPGLIAQAVMRAAKLAGLDRKRNGPFAKEVKKYYPHEMYQGGKPDDIAVVVAIAVEADQEAAIKAKL